MWQSEAPPFWQNRLSAVAVARRTAFTAPAANSSPVFPSSSLTPTRRTGTFSRIPHRPHGSRSMTRKHESKPGHDKSAANLKHLRVQIDKLDSQILDLLNKRAAIAGQ